MVAGYLAKYATKSTEVTGHRSVRLDADSIGDYADPDGDHTARHVTANHIIEVDGDRAHMNAQFIVFRIQAAARPAEGWATGTFGAQGTVQPIESGYYDTDLRRIDGEWRIVAHRILLDVPYVIPGV